VAIHFDKVEYLASLIVAKLVAFKKKLDAVGGTLRLCHLDPQVYKIFEIARLNKYFDMQGGGEDA
jgi:anti-anti-sigma factor